MDRHNAKEMSRRRIAWAFLIGYVLTTILLHRKGNELAGHFLIIYGPARYRFGVNVLTAIGAVTALVLIIRALRQNPSRWKPLIALLPVALVIDRTMLTVPVERIHYPQYGLLTWICFQAIGEPFPAALMSFLIGFVDEAHQYLVLYAGDPVIYFDWNDIALNLLGVLTVLFLILPARPRRRTARRWIAAAVASWALAAYLLVSFFRPDRYLVRDDPYKGSRSFWIVEQSKTYHVMNALQGLIFLGTLLIVTGGYYSADRSDAKQTEPRTREATHTT
jgi:hypothetical protein